MGTAREPARERLARPDSARVRHPLNEGMGRPTRPQKRSLLYVLLSLSLPHSLLTPRHLLPISALAWHPVHPILVSGGSEGAILHWDLSSPTAGTPFAPLTPHTHAHAHHHNSHHPTNPTPPSAVLTAPAPQVPPRATLSQAHDSNVWALAFHPLGHLLVSASNDHTTRFWARERPGDAASSFAPGGAKPAAAQPDDDAYDAQDDDDDALAVPGFGSSAAGAWWGAAAAPDGIVGSGGGSGVGGSAADDVVPGFGGGPSGSGSGGGGGGGEVPGLGSAGAGSGMGSNVDGQGPRGGQQADDWAYRRGGGGGGDGGGRGGGAGGYEGGGRSSGGFGGGGRGSRWGGQSTGRRGGGGRY